MEQDGTPIVVDERVVERLLRRCARREEAPPAEPGKNVLDFENALASIPGGLR
jgi:hypothetical protein